ncbi:hypothetical protein Glove_299g8 [Diversispora epigaea]|uniref:Uncharacterized protein n=1 Tax=Diversispora epigaea TaxID=1348612 RepID=A0A397I351_9GLOM|nr:hypothetical protein Glove_299g8 [Diversispora epigaea]
MEEMKETRETEELEEKCNKCYQYNTRRDWCHSCNVKGFQNEFDKWTSEEREIDEFIQQTQLKENQHQAFDRLENVTYIAKRTAQSENIGLYEWSIPNIPHNDNESPPLIAIQRKNVFSQLGILIVSAGDSGDSVDAKTDNMVVIRCLCMVLVSREVHVITILTNNALTEGSERRKERNVTTVSCYKASSRRYQSSVLIGSKIYYFGGLSPNGSKRKNDALYFDVNTSEFTAIENIPAYIHHSSSVVHPKDEDACLSIGGDYASSETGYDYKDPKQAYRFDTKTSKWSTEETSNEPSVFSSYYLTRGVSDNNGFMYFFAHEYSSFHSFIKLDINAMSWSSFNNSGDSPGEFSGRFLIRQFYTATLLQNGLIIFVGGMDNFNQAYSMNDLLFFDINSSKWSTATAQGENIDGRFDHTAVLTNDERLVIYGGSSDSNLGKEGPYPTLAVLKIGSSSYEWSIPSNDESHPPLTGHSATIYGEQMYIAFGIDPYTENAKDETIFAFNTNDFSRIVPKKSKSKSKLILGISLGLVAGLLIIGGIGGYYFCRKRKNKQKNEEIILNDNDNQNMESIGVYRNPLVTRDDVNSGYINNSGYVDNGYVDNYVDNNNPGYSNNLDNPRYVNNPRYNSNSGNPGYVNNANNPGYVNNSGYISNSRYVTNSRYYNPGYASDP